MRAGTDTALAPVVQVFGQAKPHHAHPFVNRRGNRIKVLAHDGFGLWLCARRLHQGRFTWAGGSESHRSLAAKRLQALVIGLPWHRVAEQAVIRAA
jgi:transposase